MPPRSTGGQNDPDAPKTPKKPPAQPRSPSASDASQMTRPKPPRSSQDLGPGGTDPRDSAGNRASEASYPWWDPAKTDLTDYLAQRKAFEDEWGTYATDYPDLWRLIWLDYQDNWSDDKFTSELDSWATSHDLDFSGSKGGGGGGGGGGGPSREDQVAGAYAAIRNQVGQLGLEMTDEDMQAIAGAAVDGKWNGDQLTDYLTGGIAGGQTKLRSGMVTAAVDQIKQLAASQLLTISDDTARQYASRIATEELTMDGVRSLLAGQAKLRYGWAASSIDQGLSVKDVLLPTRDFIAQELELPPETINMMDPKWLGMFQTRDENTGETRAATTDEIQLRARRDTRFGQTSKAATMAANGASMIRDIFEGRG